MRILPVKEKPKKVSKARQDEGLTIKEAAGRALVARQAFEETIRWKRMREASGSIDRIRESPRTTDWSGAREIRKMAGSEQEVVID